MTNEPQHLGLGREKPDARDALFVPLAMKAAASPGSTSINLVNWEWPVWNQGSLNSCTAQVVAAAVHYLIVKEKVHVPFDPSRLFVYFNERVLFDELEKPGGHAIDHNAPVYMRDGIKALARWGLCREDHWTDDLEDLLTKYVERPPQDAYDFAEDHKTVKYSKLDVHGKPTADKLRLFKACLTEGFPFTIGIHVYPSMSSAVEGAIPTPSDAATATGGHALLVTGFDDASQRFMIRNSWGSSWGKQGYGTIGYDYVCNDKFTDSIWTIRGAT